MTDTTVSKGLRAVATIRIKFDALILLVVNISYFDPTTSVGALHTIATQVTCIYFILKDFMINYFLILFSMKLEHKVKIL